MIPLLHFAQTTAAQCTVNGQPADCATAGKVAAGFGIFFLIFFVFGIVNFIFWITGLIHIIKHEDLPDRIMWLLILVLVPFGAIVYHFSAKRSYDRSHAADAVQPMAPPPPPPTNPVAPAPPAGPIVG